jgi:uncharacterized membrane protein YedE/YeeE
MMRTVLLGIIFGMILQRSRVNTYDKIGGFAMMKDFTVAKILLTAIGVGSILLFLEIQMGLASLSIKPFDVAGIIFGGIIFGIGMAVLGYCPGTLIVSMGEGAVDAIVGIIGGLAAGFVYILLYPRIGPLLGPDMGKGNLYVHNTAMTALIVFLFGAALTGLAFYIDKKEKGLSNNGGEI